jgi:hypothetical protein
MRVFWTRGTWECAALALEDKREDEGESGVLLMDTVQMKNGSD